MAGQNDVIRSLIPDLAPSDGPNIGSQTLLSLLQDRLRDALAELKRLQSPYLNWTGKEARISFEVDTEHHRQTRCLRGENRVAAPRQIFV